MSSSEKRMLSYSCLEIGMVDREVDPHLLPDGDRVEGCKSGVSEYFLEGTCDHTSHRRL